jgi:chemotaxis signal transduction protein
MNVDDPELLAASFNGSRVEAMTNEDERGEEVRSMDAAPHAAETWSAAETGLAMTPTEALTAGFEISAGAASGRAGPGLGRADVASRFADGESRQGFRVGELGLMIRYEDGSELSEMSLIHRLPNAPSWFCGIANLRGKLTPVFDLADYLGIEPAAAAKRMLLVLSRGADATGVIIDGLPERLRWSDAERTDSGAAPERLVPHLRGACYSGGRLWFDLDTRSLLGEFEQSLGSSQ